MRILVIGGGGFIGRPLCRKLVAQKNHDVVVLEHPSVPFVGDASGIGMGYVNCDITDAFATEALAGRVGKIDAAVHLAAMAAPAIAQKTPGVTWAVNVQGTYNVLNLLRRVDCKRVVFFSSAHVYGISPRYFPTDETHPLALQDQYTSSKLIGERLCQLFYDHHGLSYLTLRLFNGYGPEQSPDYFIPAKLKQAREAKDGILKLRGCATTKDWVHVDDVVEAACLGLTSNYVGPLNIGTGVETSLEEIATRIANAFGLKVELEGDDPATRMRADYRRAQATLGWAPKISFDEGLARLIEEAKR